MVVIPRKKPSILRAVRRYFCNSGSLALKLFLMWPEMTWEAVLITAHLGESAWSFDRARMIASYFVLLFMHWNSSLPMYLSLMPDGEVIIVAIPAPADPHPRLCALSRLVL